MRRTDLLDLFAYDAWANREALHSVRPAASAAPKAVKILAHIAGTELLWLSRIHGQPSPVPVWPEGSVEDCAQLFVQAADQWLEYLTSLDDKETSRAVSYTNTKGQLFRNTVTHIAAHVILHSHYHRGQIAAAVRAAGYEPAYTDFIHAIRSHALVPQGDSP